MSELLCQIEEAIELLRKQMHWTAERKGRLSGEVLILSQELDKLLNLYERLKLIAC